MVISCKKRLWASENQCDNERRNIKVVDLPKDIIHDILSRVGAMAISRFRSVDKSWCNLTSSPEFINSQLNKAVFNQPPSLLLAPFPLAKLGSSSYFFLLNKENNGYKATGEIIIEESLRMQLLQSDQFKIVCSCDGILCFAPKYDVNPMFVYNPITKECTTLPELTKTNGEMQKCVRMGFDDMTKKYKVVHICKDGCMGPLRCDIITLGDSSWRELEVPYDSGDDLQFHDRWDSTFIRGSLHWMLYRRFIVCVSKHILAMDINNEKFRVMEVPQSIPKYHIKSYSCDLVTLQRSLAIIVRVKDSSVVNIWKLMNTSKEIWTHHRFDMSMLCSADHADFVWFHVIDMLTDDSLVLLTKSKIDENNLVIYSPRQDRLDFMYPIPKSVTLCTFVPSFVSLKF